MPRDFSEDGASNAGSGFDPNFGTGSQTGGHSVSDFGSNGGAAGGNGQGGAYGNPDYFNVGGGGVADYTLGMIGDAQGNPKAGSYSSGPNGLSYKPLSASQTQGAIDYGTNMEAGTAGTYKSGPNGFSFEAAGSGGPRPLMFSEGGAITDDDINGSPGQDAMQKALMSVDQVLAYGRKLHGLGGGDNEGAITNQKTAAAMPMRPGTQSESGIPPERPEPPAPPAAPQQQQMAANMPMIPGTQSESGVKPIQPMPGPLPPTSNPFGKRADVGGSNNGDSDSDGDSDSGPITDDEDVA